jgi:hypothetical protein
MVAGGWWLVAGGWWLVAGGWLLVLAINHQPLFTITKETMGSSPPR